MMWDVTVVFFFTIRICSSTILARNFVWNCPQADEWAETVWCIHWEGPTKVMSEQGATIVVRTTICKAASVGPVGKW